MPVKPRGAGRIAPLRPQAGGLGQQLKFAVDLDRLPARQPSHPDR